MKTRTFLLPVLFAFCAAPGCFTSAEQPATNADAPDEKPKANPLPEAPAPREKNPLAELLVGSWKSVSVGGSKVSPGYESVTTYAKDGTMVRRVEDLNGFRVPPPRTGTYRLEGKTLRFTAEATAESVAKSWTAEIHTITETKLILVAGKEHQQSEYVRVPGK